MVALPARFCVIRPRQALFFLLAIVLPCALLVVLTTRMLVQERELGEKRLADERRRIAADLRHALLGRVERIRLDATRGNGGAATSAELALVARTDGGRLVLPWDRDVTAAAAAAALDEPRFREAVRIGERHEFIESRFAEAAAAYREAIAGARVPAQRAAAQLLLARAWAKGGRPAAAEEIYRAALDGSPDAVDDQGIPFTLYAARRLIDTPRVTDDIVDRIAASVTSLLASPFLRPAVGYMAHDIIQMLRNAATPAARLRVEQLSHELTARNADIEQALELQRAFPAANATRTSTSPAASQPWFPFGSETNQWLVNAGAAPADDVVVAIRAEPLLRAVLADSPLAGAGAASITLSTAGAGELLLPDFGGLSLVIPPATVAAAVRDTGFQRPIVVAVLAIVLSTALFGAYLFWRDVQREIRLATLRSQFVSSVSHELKTPLTAIRMFAETLLLGRASRPEVSQEYLETIVNESERLTRLLNNVLDFSKIEQGTKTYRLGPQSPADMVRHAVSAMQYPLAQQGCELRVHLDDDVPSIAADPDAIQQALLNLLSNAMKYSGDGRVIDLALTRDNGHIVIAVTDHGIGIPAGEQKRIFEKFYRVPGVDNQRIVGTGLGLTLVEHVARAHGGLVTVKSAPGEGSTFSLLLPLSPAGGHQVAEAPVVA